MQSAKPSGMWNIVKIASVVVAVLGVAILAYSGFVLASTPQGFSHGALGLNRTGAGFIATQESFTTKF